MALLITRPEGERDPLVARLRALGYRVYAVPTVATEPLPFSPPDLARFDWVVVTSATGVHALLDRIASPPAGLRWAAVGPRTAAALGGRGIAADAVPGESRGVRIAEAIGRVEGGRVLLARADAAAPDLPDALRARGAHVEELAVYHTVAGPQSSRQAVQAALADPGLTAAIFASGSAVAGLLRLGGDGARRLAAVTIGPATTAAARRHGFDVVAEAATPSVEGLVQAIQRACQI
jgi:uroporphyrinogen-III synthase